MKTKKRFLSALLSLMLIAALVLSPATAFAEEPQADEAVEAVEAVEVAASPEVLTETGAAAPVITGHPTDQTVTAGEKVSFTVNASGDDLTYRWQVNKTGTWNDCTSTGSDRSTFSFTAKESYSGWAYRCVVSNAGGRAVSEDAVLTVSEPTPPEVYRWTSGVTCSPGSTVYFNVYADGTGLTYQWQVSKDGGSTWKNCTSTGYNTATLSFTAKASYDGWQYRCRVSNSAGTDYSGVALLTVDGPDESPVITSDPDSLRISAGQRATFSVSATGTGLTYRWQVSKDGGYTWRNCTSAGCTSSTFSFIAKASYRGWQYRCAVSGGGKTVNSYAALLTVESGPVIYSASDDLEVSAGGTVDLWIYADDVDSYQWQYSKDGGSTWKNCTSAGATSERFSFTATAAMNGRLYRCVVTNAAGSTRSDPLTLTVTNKPVITSQPYAESVFAGQKATFFVEADNATGYRWQYSKDGGSTWTNCTSAGSTSATFSFKATAAMSERYYRCVVSNANGSVTSNAARLFVDTRPLITQQPKSASVTAGTEVTMQVKADRGESYR